MRASSPVTVIDGFLLPPPPLPLAAAARASPPCLVVLRRPEPGGVGVTAGPVTNRSLRRRAPPCLPRTSTGAATALLGHKTNTSRTNRLLRTDPMLHSPDLPCHAEEEVHAATDRNLAAGGSDPYGRCRHRRHRRLRFEQQLQRPPMRRPSSSTRSAVRTRSPAACSTFGVNVTPTGSSTVSDPISLNLSGPFQSRGSGQAAVLQLHDQRQRARPSRPARRVSTGTERLRGAPGLRLPAARRRLPEASVELLLLVGDRDQRRRAGQVRHRAAGLADQPDYGRK